MPRYLLLALGALGLALAGLGWWYVQSPAAVAPLPATLHVSNAPAYSIDVVPAQSSININDTVRLHFTARQNGQVHDIYGEQKVLHYVIASANYLDFYHTFSPEEVSPGKFYIDHTFTQPGHYRLWMELVDTTQATALHHGGSADLLSSVDLTVQGEQATQGIVPVRGASAVVGPYRVITDHATLVAGKPTTIRWHVEDRQGQIVPVFPEEPAIYVMVGPDFSFFRHTHTPPATQGSYIQLTETFPGPGEYLWWTEIYAKNGETYDTIQVPFVITVT